MKYPYSVKVDGKWYRPNTNIPEKVKEVETTKKLTTAKPEKVAEKSTAKGTKKKG